MQFTQFLMGLLGAFTGGILMALTMVVIYAYDKQKTIKVAQKLTEDLKSVYTERMINSKVNIKTSSGKFN